MPTHGPRRITRVFATVARGPVGGKNAEVVSGGVSAGQNDCAAAERFEFLKV